MNIVLTKKQQNKPYMTELTKIVKYNKNLGVYLKEDIGPILPFPYSGGHIILFEIVSDYSGICYEQIGKLKNILGYTYDFVKYFDEQIEFTTYNLLGLRIDNLIFGRADRFYYIYNNLSNDEKNKLFTHFNKHDFYFEPSLIKCGLNIIKKLNDIYGKFLYSRNSWNGWVYIIYSTINKKNYIDPNNFIHESNININNFCSGSIDNKFLRNIYYQCYDIIESIDY